LYIEKIIAVYSIEIEAVMEYSKI